MSTPEATASYYKKQQQIAATTAGAASKLWSRVGDDFDAGWQDVRPKALELVQLGRLAAATTSVGYTPAVLAETNTVAEAVGALVPAAFIVIAPDGRDMGSLLDETLIKAKVAVKNGAAPVAAREQAGRWMTGMLLTVMADTGRAVVGADIAQRPNLTGYVRMLNGPSCSRCIILAGKWFRWNEGFLRHPRCDCRHIPSAEDVAGDFSTDPYEAFKAMSAAEQEKAFGRIEARAIRDGADIYRVVNIKARGLGTAKGNLRFGTPSRVTIDDIYRTAGHRTNAIRMMQEHGYITGPQTRDGNVVGRMHEKFSQPISRPVVAGSNRDRVLKARETGVRNPLDRATMTAAERRLYDAHYNYSRARMTGNVPRSVANPLGLRGSDADKYANVVPVTPEKLARLRAALEVELAKLPNSPSSVKAVAESLGVAGRNVTFKQAGVRGSGVAPKAGGAGRSGGGRPPKLVPGAGGVDPDDKAWGHILGGDNKGGGHGFGNNVAGKTEFPQGWGKERISDAISAVQRPFILAGEAIQPGVYEGLVANVVVRVVITESSTGRLRIGSAYPLRGDGVFQNTPEGRVAVPLQSRDRKG